jgi:hypothetical protein
MLLVGRGRAEAVSGWCDRADIFPKLVTVHSRRIVGVCGQAAVQPGYACDCGACRPALP